MKLSERREAICLKFAKNSLRISNFRELFPEFENNHLMKTRNMEKFAVNRFHGKRYAVSAVPNMQKLLNKEYRKQKESIKKLLSPTNYACTRSYCWDNKPILLLLLLTFLGQRAQSTQRVVREHSESEITYSHFYTIRKLIHVLYMCSFLNYRYWNLLGTMMAGLCLPVDVLIFYKGFIAQIGAQGMLISVCPSVTSLSRSLYLHHYAVIKGSSSVKGTILCLKFHRWRTCSCKIGLTKCRGALNLSVVLLGQVGSSRGVQVIFKQTSK